MKVSLKPELEQFVSDQVQSGRFASPDDVIEAGLARLMLDRSEDDLDEQTLSAIEEAEAQADRGEGIPLEAGVAQLRRKHFGG